jgi:branched-chain amino acid transport system ATP-binding protein
VLQLENLNVFYGGIHALRNVSITVNAGEVVTLIGANGAGKSTTLRAITGLLTPKSGRVVFEGEEITGVPAHRRVARGISMSPEGRGIFANLTVLENLEMGAYLKKDSAAIKRDLDYGFTLFPRLKERIKQSAGTLSGGEQQMLAIGRALVTNPHLLILDEATEGLAPLVRQEIWRCLAALKAEGLSILVIDKYVRVLLGIADRHYIIERGSIQWTGASATLGQQPELWHRYLGV